MTFGPVETRRFIVYEGVGIGWKEVRACSYCWGPFRVKASAFIGSGRGRETCSDECAARNTAWSSWIRKTRPVTRSTNPALPPGGKSLAASVIRFGGDSVQPALFPVAA